MSARSSSKDETAGRAFEAAAGGSKVSPPAPAGTERRNPMDTRKKLTEGQRKALETLEEAGRPVLTSNASGVVTNDVGAVTNAYVAAGAARKLEELGLAVSSFDGNPTRGLTTLVRYELTALGRATLAELRGELTLPKTETAGATKVCPRCGLEKPRATAFQHRSNGTVFSWCRDCNRDYRRAKAAEKAKEAGR